MNLLKRLSIVALAATGAICAEYSNAYERFTALRNALNSQVESDISTDQQRLKQALASVFYEEPNLIIISQLASSCDVVSEDIMQIFVDLIKKDSDEHGSLIKNIDGAVYLKKIESIVSHSENKETKGCPLLLQFIEQQIALELQKSVIRDDRKSRVVTQLQATIDEITRS